MKPRNKLERGSTPWHALQNLARELHKDRDDPETSAARADGDVTVIVTDVRGVDPQAGWVAQANWIGPKRG